MALKGPKAFLKRIQFIGVALLKKKRFKRFIQILTLIIVHILAFHLLKYFQLAIYFSFHGVSRLKMIAEKYSRRANNQRQ